MARIRTIKPEFWKHEDLSELPEAAHLLAAALLNYADDEGYFNANPELIKAECSPLRTPSIPINKSVSLLAESAYLRLGVALDGRCFGHILTFKTHQTINKPKESKIKKLDIKWLEYGTNTVLLPDCYRGEWNREQGTGNREQGNEYCSEPATLVSEPTAAADGPPQTEGIGSCAPSVAVESGPTECDQQVTVLSFPCVGRGPTEWLLTETKLSEYQESFPDLDVLAELRKARQWSIDNRAKRKTHGGTPSFLTRWLSKAQNGGNGGRHGATAKSGDPRGTFATAEAYLNSRGVE